MTSRYKEGQRFSAESEQQVFDRALKKAVELGVWPDRMSLTSPFVWKAIGKVADEYPTVNPLSIQLAQKAFGDYLIWRSAS
jgi:hypothetical protein